jgi:ribosome biogenesis GTPase / thiamine phosphate phosphatase
MTLSSLGWNDFFAKPFQPFSAGGFVPARVALEHKHAYELLVPDGPLTAGCTGKLLHDAATRGDLPAVGDWVVACVRDERNSPGARPGTTPSSKSSPPTSTPCCS